MKNAAIVMVAALGLAAGSVQASEALAKSGGCLTCHNVTGAKKMGASFKDLSVKFKGKAGAEEEILAKLGDAKKHPASKASADDKKAIVKWILAM